MVTYPLVERINLDLPALVALSLEKHGIPVSHRFLIRSLEPGQWQVVVISPAVDDAGVRDVYSRAFEALKDEAFSTRQFLSTHLLLLGEAQAREALDRIQKGVSHLSSLGPYEEVDVYPVPDAGKIEKQGFLYFRPAGNDVISVAFAPLGDGGGLGLLKPMNISADDLDSFLAGFSVYETDKQKVLDAQRQNRTESILAQTDLKTLYEKGLV
jgi:hypothetical protein